jgi:hypothetical protein
LIDDGHEHWAQLIVSLPRPWSVEFSSAYTERLLHFIEKLEQDPTSVPYDGLWPASFKSAVHGMPVELLAALPKEIIANPEQGTTWQIENWQRTWRALHETITLRQRIISEIGPVRG